eukprot:CAMPEP_0174277674 /NCGR_PEP_ID=MMETSP0439-20130205/61060_1 /TAXON_ID=0 /ORGANISM="Stereomyxa ramosa, Strain Chinc5" /LENGTH=136 /DNA_ID=CAMNT_0015370013 /DNA_START=406 /DNA_END=816 /DNA_ORIENTATION=-
MSNLFSFRNICYSYSLYIGLHGTVLVVDPTKFASSLKNPEEGKSQMTKASLRWLGVSQLVLSGMYCAVASASEKQVQLKASAATVVGLVSLAAYETYLLSNPDSPLKAEPKHYLHYLGPSAVWLCIFGYSAIKALK